MSYVVSQLLAVLSLEDRGFTSGMRGAREETQKTGRQVQETGKQMENTARALSTVGTTLTVGLTAPLLALGRQAIKTTVQLDGLKRGLVAVSGSSAEADKQLKRLETAAKLPGLGFQQAIQGTIRLQAAGIAAQKSEKALIAMGGALATVGKGKAQLDLVTLALSQIATKSKVSAEEINQLKEQLPQIGEWMKTAFGTADTELIQKAGIAPKAFLAALIDTAAKSKQTTAGLRDDFDNATDSIERSLDRLGQNIAPKAARFLTALADKAEELSTAFGKLPRGSQDLLVTLGLVGLSAGPGLAAIGAIAQLALNLKALGVSMATLGVVGAGGLVVLAGIVSFLPHINAAAETQDLNEQSAKQDASLPRLMKIRNNLPVLRDYQQFQKKSPGIVAPMRFDDAVQFAGLTYQSTPKEVEAAIQRLSKDAQTNAGNDFRKANAANSPLNQAKVKVKAILDAAALAAKKAKGKEDAETAKRNAESLASNNRAADRQIKLNAAPNEWARKLLEVDLDYEESQSDPDKKVSGNRARTLRAQKRKQILADQKKEQDEEAADASKKWDGIDKHVKRVLAERTRKLTEISREIELAAIPTGMKWASAKKKLDFGYEDKKTELGPEEALSWYYAEYRKLMASQKAEFDTGTQHGETMGMRDVQLSGTGINQKRTPAERLAELRVLAGSAAGFHTPFINPTFPVGSGGAGAGSAQRELNYAARQVWHHRAGRAGADIAGDIGQGSREFSLDLMHGASPRQAASRLSESIIEAMRQGAGKEIERSIARSLTNPLAKAIERGFDPVAKKLTGGIQAALESVTGTAAALISSAYALMAISQRKKKFGVGSLIGGALGFMSGGPAGAIAGYNIGNALDNGDIAGAATGYLATSISQDVFRQPFRNGGSGARVGGGVSGQALGLVGPRTSGGQTGTSPLDLVDGFGRGVVINATGWTVNSQADENRLITNMARRVRVASLVGG